MIQNTKAYMFIDIEEMTYNKRDINSIPIIQNDYVNTELLTKINCILRKSYCQ